MAVAATLANPLLGSIERSSETGTENTPILQIILENINTICDGMPKSSKYNPLMLKFQTELKKSLSISSNDQAIFDRVFLKHLDDLLNTPNPTYVTAINAAAAIKHQDGVEFTLKLKTLRSLLYHELAKSSGLRLARKLTYGVAAIGLLGTLANALRDIIGNIQGTGANASAGLAELLPTAVSLPATITYVLQNRITYRLQTSIDKRHSDPIRNGPRLVRANLLLWLATAVCTAAFATMFMLYNTNPSLLLAGIGAGGLMGLSTFLPMAIGALYLLCYSAKPMPDADIARAIAMIKTLPPPSKDAEAKTSLLSDYDHDTDHVELPSPVRRPSTAGGTSLFLGTPAGGGAAAAAAAATP